jgi:eukaryotic-like serine/threonine-protein kinase
VDFSRLVHLFAAIDSHLPLGRTRPCAKGQSASSPSATPPMRSKRGLETFVGTRRCVRVYDTKTGKRQELDKVVAEYMAIEAGQKIGEYQVIGKLGAGGLGEVYEVRHLISQRHEAMKVLSPGQLGTPEMEERFRREVQTLASLNHVNIAALHTAFYHENRLIMVMELIHGETLRDLLSKTPVTPSYAFEFAAQILQALIYAHGMGVVHRDIKPSNIMITRAGIVKLLDFGIAITGHSNDLTLTHAGYVLGSINYMSPEQLSGNKATARSDIYSVGVTFYELFTGKLPFAGSTNYEIMMAHMQQQPLPPQKIAPHLPLPVSDAILKALAKDPIQRFSTAAEFLQALQSPSTRTGQDLVPPVSPLALASAQSAPMVPQQKSPSGSGFQTLPLQELSRRLAVYIGPIATLVVKKLAAQSDDLDYIHREAAKEIPSESDRAAFLRSKPL